MVASSAMTTNGRAPQGWVREWVNDDCGCTALSVYRWRANDDGSFTPTLHRFAFQRSLFCGRDPAAEIRSWHDVLEQDQLPHSTMFAIQGNTEHPQG